MFFATSALFARGQYKTRIKTRAVGYIPKVIPRKLKNCVVALRSEANTAFFRPYFKNETERLDQTGRKLKFTIFDPILQRYVLAQETKIRGPYLTKAHVQQTAKK